LIPESPLTSTGSAKTLNPATAKRTKSCFNSEFLIILVCINFVDQRFFCDGGNKSVFARKTCTFIGKVVFTLVPWMMRDYS
jgi:hypothetical protein